LKHKFYIESLGCAKNQVDSEALASALGAEGGDLDSAENADTIIVNSCGFIEEAKQQSINTVIELRRRFPSKKIILAGCLAKRYHAKLSASLKEADEVFSGELLELTGLKDSTLYQNRPLFSPPGSAFVKIAEGCNNRCSFCAIPLMRGPLKSREIDDIMNEFRALRLRGLHELCLIAQDTAAFGMDKAGHSLLSGLLAAISAEKGDFWVRLLYLHPDHFPLEILPLMRGDPRLLPYFDIPLQHASKTLLLRMKRRGSADLYLELINKIRAALPNAVLRSTFLTGFPGESEADFEKLLDFQTKARLDWLGVFCYSREEGTPAADFETRPSARTAMRRKKILEEAQISITQEKLGRFLESELDILVEEKTGSALYRGRAFNQAPEVDGVSVLESKNALTPGKTVKGRVKAISGFDLKLCAV
jgi:ribosomal protein S12 methylthiotransferase